MVSVDFKNRDVEQLVSNLTSNKINEKVNEKIVENIITPSEPMQIIDKIPSVTETKPRIVSNEKENEQNNIQPSSLLKSKSKYEKSKETVGKNSTIANPSNKFNNKSNKKNG